MACHEGCCLKRANSKKLRINCSKTSVASEWMTYLDQYRAPFRLCCCCHSECANEGFCCIGDKPFCRGAISKFHGRNYYEGYAHKAVPPNFLTHLSHRPCHMRRKSISSLSQSVTLVGCAANITINFRNLIFFDNLISSTS
jgi:hypothetical protein